MVGKGGAGEAKSALRLKEHANKALNSKFMYVCIFTYVGGGGECFLVS